MQRTTRAAKMGTNNHVNDDANISSTDKSSQSAVSAPQSSQASFPSAAGHAVGVGADCIFVGGFAEESYADNGDDFENGEKHTSPNDELGRGGLKGDSASVEVSAMTTARSVCTLSSPAAMNKLHFSSLGLHGRKHETEVLNGCFDRFVAKSASGDSGWELDININNISKSNEVVFISGESGVGKVRLNCLFDGSHELTEKVKLLRFLQSTSQLTIFYLCLLSLSLARSL